jgi:hypothetical protein
MQSEVWEKDPGGITLAGAATAIEFWKGAQQRRQWVRPTPSEPHRATCMFLN